MTPSPVPEARVIDGVEYLVTVECLSNYYARRAEYEDAIPQPPFLREPEDVLQDEAGFNEYRVGKPGLLITLFEQWFREQTGIIVCATWNDGFAYRPKHTRDPKGVWKSWGKHTNWLKRLILSEGDENGRRESGQCGRQGSDAVADSHGEEQAGHRPDGVRVPQPAEG